MSCLGDCDRHDILADRTLVFPRMHRKGECQHQDTGFGGAEGVLRACDAEGSDRTDDLDRFDDGA